MKRTLLAALLIFTSLFHIACPKDSVVRKAARASYELSGLTRDVIAATGKAYDAQILTLDQKNQIARKLQMIAAGGARFNQIATAANNSNTNPSVITTLNLILSNEITAPFLEILQILGAISPTRADYLQVTLAALRTAILTISAAVSQNTHDRFLNRSEGATWAIATAVRTQTTRSYQWQLT